MYIDPNFDFTLNQNAHPTRVILFSNLWHCKIGEISPKKFPTFVDKKGTKFLKKEVAAVNIGNWPLMSWSQEGYPLSMFSKRKVEWMNEWTSQQTVSCQQARESNKIRPALH
jgi:hypothetical protein